MYQDIFYRPGYASGGAVGVTPQELSAQVMRGGMPRMGAMSSAPMTSNPEALQQGLDNMAVQRAMQIMGNGAQNRRQATDLAQRGRGGDSTLVHMQPREVAGLEALAQMSGRNLTTNPQTGLPEAFSLGDLLGNILPMALMFVPGMQWAAPLASAGVTYARTGDLGAAALSGVGSYGLGQLGNAFAAQGAGQLASQAPATTAGMLAGQQLSASGLDSLTQQALGDTAANMGMSAVPVADAANSAGMLGASGAFNPLAPNPFGGVTTPTIGGVAPTPNPIPNPQNMAFKPDASGKLFGAGATPPPQFAKLPTPSPFPSLPGQPTLGLDIPTGMGATGIDPTAQVAAMQTAGTPHVINPQMPPAPTPANTGFMDKMTNYAKETFGEAGTNFGNTIKGVQNVSDSPGGWKEFLGRTEPGNMFSNKTNAIMGLGGTLGGMMWPDEYDDSDSSGSSISKKDADAYKAAGAAKFDPDRLRDSTVYQPKPYALTGERIAYPIQPYPVPSKNPLDPYTRPYAQGGLASMRHLSPMPGGKRAKKSYRSAKAMIKAMYPNKQDAIRAMKDPESVLAKLGITNANDSLLYHAYKPTVVNGPGDGSSDSIPATIGGSAPALLSDGEVVVPADVVSHIGNGSTQAGAKRLVTMFDDVRSSKGAKKGLPPRI